MTESEKIMDRVRRIAEDLEEAEREGIYASLIATGRKNVPEVGLICVNPRALPDLLLPVSREGIEIRYSEYLADDCGAVFLKTSTDTLRASYPVINPIFFKAGE